MSKSRKPRNEQDRAPQINISLPESMSQEEMKKLIVASLLAYDQAKEDLENKKLEEEKRERRKLVGYKDYSNHKLIPCLFLTGVNRSVAIIRILFMGRAKIKGETVTTSLMRIAVSYLFSAVKLILWLVCGVCVFSYPLSLILPNVSPIVMPMYLAYIGIGILAFVFAQLFRIASIEIQKIKSHNYIVDIFAATVALVAVIIALFK